MGWTRVTAFTVLLICISFPAAAYRSDVLVVVNDNSLDSPQLGAYYAQQRNIDPSNIVHVNVPNSFFIDWTGFRSLRDQLIRFMQDNTLTDPLQEPLLCTDGEPPYYCTASVEQLRRHSRIRYVVLTRGVPTRVRVDGSTVFTSPDTPSSVDNYLKYWLVNYFPGDVDLWFPGREEAFGDGRGMRTVIPSLDRELIVGRIDGLSLAAAQGRVDRTLAAEAAGLYGRLYGSTAFHYWGDYQSGQDLYPASWPFGWPALLGLWGETRPECIDYLDASGNLPEGKSPSHCTVHLNEDGNPDNLVGYPAPGNAGSRQPQAVDALVYQGWRDGQSSVGSFASLLNWRRDDQCSITLCRDAADQAACAQNSTDIFKEINTDCVGVAQGFMGYNHQSFPVSYQAVWPTGWFQSADQQHWNLYGHGDVHQLAFPEVRNNCGYDDNFSLWFRNSDQVTDPRCYTGSDFSSPPAVLCPDERRVVLTQRIDLPEQVLDAASPPAYHIRFHYRAVSITRPVDLTVRLFVHESGAGKKQVDYGTQTVTTIMPGDTPWTEAVAQYTLDPLLHAGMLFDGLKFTIETTGLISGELGIDAVSVQRDGDPTELVRNGSFDEGHLQVTTGDHAATFLDRLGGVAFWGSVGHHQSGGYSFWSNGLEMLVYFMRGLPLGDAVWFGESYNSGILYGDPLYSPVAVRLEPLNAADTVSGRVALHGSAVNGRDQAQVETTYRVDMCAGEDFLVCDWSDTWQATGVQGVGGEESMWLGDWDTSGLSPGSYTLRLSVASRNLLSGRSQTFNDHYAVTVQGAGGGGGGCALAIRTGRRGYDPVLWLFMVFAVCRLYWRRLHSSTSRTIVY